MTTPDHDLYPRTSDQPADDTTWTAEGIRALGLATDIATAARIFGLSRAAAYDLAKQDRFPVAVLKFGTATAPRSRRSSRRCTCPGGNEQPRDPLPPPPT